MSWVQKSYSQCGEDIIMLFLLRHVLGIEDIYYLDLGANEAVKLNNTCLFYENGYRGVSVDANPYFKSEYKELRPEDVFVCCGVGTQDGEEVFYEIDPHTLSTFSKKEAESYTNSGLHKLVSEDISPIYTVATIIERYCKKTPNVLSLDVEGLDLEVLKSTDFHTWRPSVICVETLTYTQDASEEKNEEIIEFLKDKKYRIYADTYINTIFVDNDIWDKRK